MVKVKNTPNSSKYEIVVLSLQTQKHIVLLSKSFQKINYRPEQPNWEYTMWKFQDFSASQILREINFGPIEDPKTAILTIWAALNYKILDIFDIFKFEIFIKIKIQSLQNC